MGDVPAERREGGEGTGICTRCQEIPGETWQVGERGRDKEDERARSDNIFGD